MYVRGNLQGSENGRVVTIGLHIGSKSNYHIYDHDDDGPR
jgi:hypothetical protein